MEEVGVELIVKGLQSFLDGMKKADKGIAGIVPTTSLLGRAFQGLGSIISGLVSGAFRVLEYALGGLLKDAIESVLSSIREMISEVITAGGEFQTLELRLKNLNFNTAIESGMEYNAAIAEATKLTKEQLGWVQKLAVQSPYNATDIANVFTLARSYSFSADKAKGLTEDITKFAAGMGLGNEEIERIIVNFGQMSQQANVNQRDLNDLARGSFVPINDILDIMRTKTGLTGDAFDEFTHSAEGVTAFTEAFSTLVEQRFSKSSEAMARTFQGATSNAKDFITSLVGLSVVKPILDTLGGKIADFTDALSSRFDEASSIVGEIGTTLSEIISTLVGGLPSATSFADAVINGLQGISDWLKLHQDDIVSWVKTAIDGVVIFAGWIKNTLIPALIELSRWIIDNKDSILAFVAFIAFAVTAIGALIIVLGKIFKTLTTLATIFVVVGTNASFFAGILSLLVPVIGVLITVVAGIVGSLGTFVVIIASVIATIGLAVIAFTVWKTMALIAIQGIIKAFKDLYNNAVQTISNIKSAFYNADWYGVGKAIVQGMINGVSSLASNLAKTAADAAKGALTAAKSALHIESPSKDFEEIGKMTIQGMIVGINKMVGSATSAMTDAMGSISMPAIATPALVMASTQAPSSVVNNTTSNNYNLNVSTQSRSEPIISDFAMLRSLGAT